MHSTNRVLPRISVQSASLEPVPRTLPTGRAKSAQPCNILIRSCRGHCRNNEVGFLNLRAENTRMKKKTCLPSRVLRLIVDQAEKQRAILEPAAETLSIVWIWQAQETNGEWCHLLVISLSHVEPVGTVWSSELHTTRKQKVNECPGHKLERGLGALRHQPSTNFERDSAAGDY